MLSYISFTEQKMRLPVSEIPNMNVVVYSVTALSVAVLFYGWRAYQDTINQRHKQLRERVAYMLWVMANSSPDHA
jgi:hypothetical protein